MPSLRSLGEPLASFFGQLAFRFLDWLGGITIAGLLWMAGCYDWAVAAWVDPKFAAILLSPRFHSAPLFLVFVVFCWWLRAWSRTAFRPRSRDGERDRPLRIRRQPWFRRFNLWRKSLGKQPWYWKIGKQVASLTHTHGLVVGGSGSGKALALDTPVPTPTGWTTMGELRVGDVVFDDAGQPTTVTHAWDVRVGRPCYEVVFSDGTTVVADADHQWLTHTWAVRRSMQRKAARDAIRRPDGWHDQQAKLLVPAVATTKEVAETLYRSVRGECNHAVRAAGPLSLPTAALPVDPYVLGCWLGDGNSASARITVAEDELLDRIRAAGCEIRKTAGLYQYTLGDGAGQGHPPPKLPYSTVKEIRLRVSAGETRRAVARAVCASASLVGMIANGQRRRSDETPSLQTTLRALGVLNNKHVPASYLRASAAQRLALLQGLMDTDGHANGSQAEFAVTSKRLADAAYELVVSLGMKATRSERHAKLNGVAHGTAYRVTFTPTMDVFRLTRKQAGTRFDVQQQSKRTWRYITVVRPVASVPVRCIAVDAPSHLFLVSRGFVPTHNSTLVVALILQPTLNLFMWLMRRLGRWHRRAVLIISFDRSDPIEEATNVLEDSGVEVERWRVRQSNGWDMLQGDIEMIAEALPDGWSKADGDTGFFRQLCSDSISAALHQQDDAGLPRDFNDMIERMDKVMAADPEIPDLARRTWARRFRSLARVMGESLGSDFDLVEALQDRKVVHLSSNSYTNPALTPLVGAMAITHAKLAAEQVGDVYLVLEEASFLKARSAILDDLARSMRARGWRVVYLSQDPNDVGNVLQVNFGVAVFMGLGPLASKARQWCADVVKGLPGAFRAEELVLGATIDQLEGYVLLNGRCRDVSIAPYITRPAEHRPARPSRRGPRTAGRGWRTSGQNGGAGVGQAATRHGDPGRSGQPGGVRFEIISDRAGNPGQGWAESSELPEGRPLALPAGKKSVPTCVAGHEKRMVIWDKLSGTWNPLGCHLWLERSRNRGYGKTWYANMAGQSPHFLCWAWRVMEDHELGRAGDLEVFYARHPEIPMFVWPVKGSEDFVVLTALKQWMRKPDPHDPKMNLQVDHRCPGAPNTLCANYRHLWLLTYLENTQLRNQRKNGKWHDKATEPDYEESVVC